MKKIALLTLAIVLFAAPVFAADIMAAAFHADWCTTCKVMGSTYQEVLSRYEGQLKKVKFDKTDDATSAKSLELAKELRIDEIYQAHNKTGFILLIDDESKVVVGKLSKGQTAEQMTAIVDAVLTGKNVYKSLKEDKGSSMKASSEKESPMKKGSMKGSGY